MHVRQHVCTLIENVMQNMILQVLPGFEPGLLDSKSKVITNYTIGPIFDIHNLHVQL